MKNPVIAITFTPVAMSIIFSILLGISEYVPVLPVWVLWQAVMASTIIAFLVVALHFVVWAAQIAAHKITNQTYVKN